MPRDGSGIYSYPVGTPGIPDQTIESARYNNFLNDIEKDQNDPRPILTGGTGADNAVTAMINLSGEIAKQLVTNYDLHPFQSGSFYSAGTASGHPTYPATHAYSGICYKVDDANMVLEARNNSDTLVPGRPYIREKKAGLWSAWVTDNYITKFGPSTMEGPLTIDPTGPGDATIILNSDVANQNLIWGDKAGKHRWVVILGNGTAEAGAEAGSDFTIYSYKDDGTWSTMSPFTINRKTGLITVQGNPTAANGIANKAYVDTQDAAEVTRANAAYQAKDPLLYAGIPQSYINADYNTVATDANKMVTNWGGGGNRYVGIQGHLYPVNTCISFFAFSGLMVLNNSETMVWCNRDGNGASGQRVLAQYGVATAVKWVGGNWVISGNGLT